MPEPETNPEPKKKPEPKNPTDPVWSRQNVVLYVGLSQAVKKSSSGDDLSVGSGGASGGAVASG